MILRSAALSDIGRVRHQNEDRYLCDDRLRLYGVADGVGGLPGGARAAQRAVDTSLKLLRPLGEDADLEVDLKMLLQLVNRDVAAAGQQYSPGIGIATTLTLGLILDEELHIGHVGDSRCYLWRDGELTLLTEDHSVENEARRRRERGEVVVFNEGNRNALTRCIGQPGDVQVDVLVCPLRPGDRVFFCSDGISKLVPHAELTRQVGMDRPPEASMRALVDAALTRGGVDNATGVLIRLDADPADPADGA